MKRKVLIVDDEQETIDFLESFFNRFDFLVNKTGFANTALEIYDAVVPELVFLDITMPDMDGITLLRKLRKISETPKIFMLTANNDKKNYDKAKRYGAFGYITKPVDLAELKVIIDENNGI
ncbi:MAG: response regulator [Candidatus Omnitrophica bacterium]|nr:response regulator [Candidatus Omnitrophota bacterium]